MAKEPDHEVDPRSMTWAEWRKYLEARKKEAAELDRVIVIRLLGPQKESDQ